MITCMQCYLPEWVPICFCGRAADDNQRIDAPDNQHDEIGDRRRSSDDDDDNDDRDAHDR